MDEGRRRSWACAIDGAHRDGWLLEPITDAEYLDANDAYEIQRELSRLRQQLPGGDRIGWKIGYSSAVMQQQMSMDRPNFGPLTANMIVVDGLVDAPLAQPRIEPELAIVLCEDLTSGARLCDVGAAVDRVHLAIEVVDSIWIDYRFHWEDNTADGSSAAGVVVGPALPWHVNLAAATIELSRDGEVLGRGRGGDIMGHPYAAVRWLASELPRYGESLRAGDIVLTGGLTRAVPLEPDASFVAEFEDLQCRVVWPSSRHGRLSRAAHLRV